MDGINRVTGIRKTLGINSKLIRRSAYRQQYVGVETAEHGDPHLQAVGKIPPVQKYHDNAGILAKKLDRVINYKEEYRHYYQLEQGLEESFDVPIENMDFIDHLYAVLTDLNEVIQALLTFDKAFNTTYSQLIGVHIKNHEEALTNASVMIHVDNTLGFFKGRMKRIYDLHPEYFDFFVENHTGLIPELIGSFRTIKAIIPEKIEDMTIKQDKTGAIIDHKL